MFSRLEVPDVGEGVSKISRISSSDVCRNWKLCFLTLTGRFNEGVLFYFIFSLFSRQSEEQRCEVLSRGKKRGIVYAFLSAPLELKAA